MEGERGEGKELDYFGVFQIISIFETPEHSSGAALGCKRSAVSLNVKTRQRNKQLYNV